ncbi:MAG: metal-sensitive transcriptional regulator [Actinomycetaceae bacterium]|nr:metal-sensitive transcriptional regulator [Arcanobacterium sp.]MDD7505023.1 metal-sensitive transcriptional regulator [Actinomycetaceae bacterium]
MSAQHSDKQTRILNRLRRAQGQLNAVISKIETGARCRDVVTQLSAVSTAIDRAGYLIIACAMENTATAESGSPTGTASHTGSKGGGNSRGPVDAQSPNSSHRKRVNQNPGFLEGETLTPDEIEKLFLMLS